MQTKNSTQKNNNILFFLLAMVCVIGVYYYWNFGKSTNPTKNTNNQNTNDLNNDQSDQTNHNYQIVTTPDALPPSLNLPTQTNRERTWSEFTLDNTKPFPINTYNRKSAYIQNLQSYYNGYAKNPKNKLLVNGFLDEATLIILAIYFPNTVQRIRQTGQLEESDYKIFMQ